MSCLGRIHQFPRNFVCWQAPGCIYYIFFQIYGAYLLSWCECQFGQWLAQKYDQLKQAHLLDLAPLSRCLYVHEFIHLSTCLSISMSVHLYVSPSLCLSISMSVHLYVCPSLCLSISMSVHLYVCPSLCLTGYVSAMSIYIYIYISVCLSREY